MRVIAGLLISAAFLYATFRTIPLQLVFKTLVDCHPAWIGFALGCIAFAFFVKIFRWTAMLRNLGADVGISETAPPLLGAVALNNVFPLRAGDVVRVFSFKHYTGVPTSGQISTLALERLMDILSLCSILFVALSVPSALRLDRDMLIALRILLICAVVAVAIFISTPHAARPFIRLVNRRFASLGRFADAVERFGEDVEALSKPGFLLRIFALSVVAWLGEGAAFLAVGKAIGIGFRIDTAMVALSVGTLSTIIPSSPGYVGTFHFFVTKVISAFGVGATLAATYAVLIHALLWLSTTITGFTLLACTSEGRRAGASLSLSRQS